MSAPSPPRPRTRRWWRVRTIQWPAIAWLTLVWVAVWGDWSGASIATGVAVALGVCLVFPLPALRMNVRVRLLHLCWLMLVFLADLVVASVQVAWTTMQFGRQPRNAVIEVDLDTPSDLVLTVVAVMVSLVPGSLVVEARRSTHTLFLHVFDARDAAGVHKMRQQVHALERRVVWALGAQTDHLSQHPDRPEGDEEESS